MKRLTIVAYLLWAIVMLIVGTITWPNPLAGIFAAIYIYFADDEYRKPAKAEVKSE